MRRLNEWLSNLLQEKGADIYRSKGILNVAGTDEK
jgi:G3E family GTPase